jgi:methionyl-tRNA synthetase
MIARYFDGDLPHRASDDSTVRSLLDGLAADVASRLDEYDLTGALERIWEVVRGLNRFVEEQAPWQLAKDPALRQPLERTLYDLADGLRVVAVALASYLPDTSSRILSARGVDPEEVAWDAVEYGRTPEGTGIAAASPLFPRIDAPTTAA